MRNDQLAPGERPGLITRLAIAALAYLVAILLAAVAAAAPGTAAR